MHKLMTVTFFLCFIAVPASAFFELTAAARKGGRDIRFDAGLASQGAREEDLSVTVESDEGVQYRLYMTFLSPLTNEQGKTLPTNALYVFSPDNTLGELRMKLEAPLPLGQSTLYTSNSAGDSDRFTLVFHLNLPEDAPGGVYRSSLSFTLEPVTPVAGLMPRTVTLEIRVEAKPAFRLTVQNEKGAARLDLGKLTKKGPAVGGALQFMAESNIGQSYRVFQELRGPLVSETGSTLPDNAVRFAVENVSEGNGAGGGTLESSSSLLYESASSGGPARWRAVYSVEVDPTTPAGRFTGMLVVRVESSSPYAAGQVFQIPVIFEIEPVFNLEIDIPNGFSLSFGHLRSGEEAPQQQVFLKVRSNLRQPYQISQVVLRKMSTPEGSALPENAFRYAVQKPATGNVEAIAERPVPPGESPLFLSDSSGTPEIITATYFLTIPIEAKSGPYGTEIKYSITTL